MCGCVCRSVGVGIVCAGVWVRVCGVCVVFVWCVCGGCVGECVCVYECMCGVWVCMCGN